MHRIPRCVPWRSWQPELFVCFLKAELFRKSNELRENTWRVQNLNTLRTVHCTKPAFWHDLYLSKTSLSPDYKLVTQTQSGYTSTLFQVALRNLHPSKEKGVGKYQQQCVCIVKNVARNGKKSADILKTMKLLFWGIIHNFV